jgi:hypothetical protein
MAHYHARSGATRSDALVSGLYTRSVALTIGGTARASQIQKDQGFSITHSLNDQPAQGTLWTRRFLPTMYHEVILRNGGSNGKILFRGRVLGLNSTAKNQAVAARHQLSVIGDHWLMDRFALVTGRYRNQGANTIAAHILASFTNGGFTVGSIPASLGDIEAIDFTDEPVSKALTRVAQAVNAVWRLDPERRISMAGSGAFADDANAPTLVASVRGYEDFRVTEDGHQTRTRVIYEGIGSTASADVGANATLLPVDETRHYRASGGTVRVNQNTVTYTGVSASSGPGNLTGCSGITYDISVGEPVNVIATRNDGTAQSNLATALGGGLSGIITDKRQDGRLSLVECEERGDTDLLNAKAAPKGVSYATPNEFSTVGKLVAVNVTAPRTVNESFRIQSVTMRPRGVFSTTKADFMYDVDASPYRRTIADMLAGTERLIHVRDA